MQSNLTLSLAGKNLKSLNEEFIENRTEIEHLDLSLNRLKFGRYMTKFPNLKTLIIDGNRYSTLEDFPELKSLVTFSAMKNNFVDLEIFLEQCKLRFPNLQNLSLLKNPCCPFFEGEDKYHNYRVTIVRKYPKLLSLDGMKVDLT
jgi:Leucine-rich repeat (LRR) protein